MDFEWHVVYEMEKQKKLLALRSFRGYNDRGISY